VPTRPRIPRARRALVLAAAAAAALALSACSATGVDNETQKESSVVIGGSGSNNSVIVRNALISGPPTNAGYPAGTNLPLVAYLQAYNGDRLVSITTPDAASATITIGSVPAATTASAPLFINPASDGSLALPTNVLITVVATLNQSSQALIPTDYLPVTFTFSVGAPITISVPVDSATGQ
jgi:hypothetical protein